MEYVYPIYEKENIDKMRIALANSRAGTRNLLYFEIGLATALRCSDLLKLTKKDVKDGIIEGRSKKKDKQYRFRLKDDLVKMIEVYTAHMHDDAKLFPIDRTTVHRFIKKAALEADIPEPISSHSIRKTKAYHFFNDNDKDLVATMDLLQHDDTKSTLSYIGISQKVLEEKMEKHLI